MSLQWIRDSSFVFESRDQAFSEVETLSKEHSYRVMQIDGYPPAYAIERKLPDRVQKYADDEADSMLPDEDRVFEVSTKKKGFKIDGVRRSQRVQRDRDEGIISVPSDEELYSEDFGDEWG